jgi:hypothetical protein
VPELDLNAVWVTEIERFANAFNVPYGGASYALAVEMGSPTNKSLVRRHSEGEMIESRTGWFERLAGVPGVLVEVHVHTVEPKDRPLEAELINRVRRKEDNAPEDVAIEIETSAQIRYGDGVVIKFDRRG